MYVVQHDINPKYTRAELLTRDSERAFSIFPLPPIPVNPLPGVLYNALLYIRVPSVTPSVSPVACRQCAAVPSLPYCMRRAAPPLLSWVFDTLYSCIALHRDSAMVVIPLFASKSG